MKCALEQHARRELELIGEEPGVIDWYCRVISEFDSAGHSGGSTSVAIPVLHELLQWHPLSPITNDPAEWIDQSHASGRPLWQNRRDCRAFSEDGGQTWKVLAAEAAAS